MPRLGSNSRRVTMIGKEHVFICILNQVTIVSMLGNDGFFCV